VKRPEVIGAADGKLGVLLPGLGAVATTTIAGIMLARRGLAPPIGSLTELGTIRLGKRTDGNSPKIRDFIDLPKLADLEFGAWDIFEEDAHAAASHAKVLDPHHLDAVKAELSKIKPMKGVFYPEYVKKLHGTHVKQGGTKADMVEAIRDDIRTFKKEKGCSRAVAVWCGSTEVYIQPGDVHGSIESFEKGLLKNDPLISAAQIYAWACMKEKVPYANGAPNLALDFPAAWDLAKREGVATSGKDFKTGQTLMKTIIAPGLKARMLGIKGWFSTNILGNRDGEVLDDPGSFMTKEVSKLGVLEHILDA